MLCLSEIQSPNTLRTSIFRQVCGALFATTRLQENILNSNFAQIYILLSLTSTEHVDLKSLIAKSKFRNPGIGLSDIDEQEKFCRQSAVMFETPGRTHKQIN